VQDGTAQRFALWLLANINRGDDGVRARPAERSGRKRASPFGHTQSGTL
jgi:hypothetical protein